jgi:hypothetical protein
MARRGRIAGLSVLVTENAAAILVLVVAAVRIANAVVPVEEISSASARGMMQARANAPANQPGPGRPLTSAW